MLADKLGVSNPFQSLEARRNGRISYRRKRRSKAGNRLKNEISRRT
jgi:hypothetical protein